MFTIVAIIFVAAVVLGFAEWAISRVELRVHDRAGSKDLARAAISRAYAGAAEAYAKATPDPDLAKLITDSAAVRDAMRDFEDSELDDSLEVELIAELQSMESQAELAELDSRVEEDQVGLALSTHLKRFGPGSVLDCEVATDDHSMGIRCVFFSPQGQCTVSWLDEPAGGEAE